MIRTHKFNTRWWGRPVGIVDDAGFFEESEEARQTRLRDFDWVEFKAGLTESLDLKSIHDSGFFLSDVQLGFQLNLARIGETDSTRQLKVNSADQAAFDIRAESLAPFRHERFQHLPGCSIDRINERYALWANELIQQSPATCLQLFLDNKLEGWFLARPGESGRLDLTLAMLSADATISGMLLYQKACSVFAERGHRLGKASFSVTNTAVHNMYAAMGARFTQPQGIWLRLKPELGEIGNG
jgi:hypothetical protein